jgi:hypothetical protein
MAGGIRIDNFLHFPHIIPDATQTSDGLMSAADKAKLDALAPGGGVVAYEVLLTTTNPTDIISSTPAVDGLIAISVYFRVTVAETVLTVAVEYTDHTGAQTVTLVSAVSFPVGSYALPVATLGATASPVRVTLTAGTANHVTASAAMESV